MSTVKSFLLGVLAAVLIPLVGALLYCKLGFVGINADATPSWIEHELADLAREASIERNAPKGDNPVKVSDETLKTGVTLYKDNCAGCHGGSQGASDFGLAFYPAAPQFVNRKKPFGDSDGELFYVIKHGIRLTGMPAFGSETKAPLLKDDEIWTIVSFLKAMQSLPPSVEEEWRGHASTPPGASPSAAPSSSPSKDDDD